MQLSSRATVALRSTSSSRRTIVCVKASSDGGVFAGLLRIFTPARHLTLNKEEFPENTGYSGNVRHGQPRRPFKDGFSNVVPAPRKPVPVVAGQPDEATGPMEYLNEAAQRVVSNNFRGDETEPDWTKMGSHGWKGDRRSKKSDGFHSLKM